MPLNQDDNQKDHLANTAFISEKIKQRPINRKKLIRRTLITISLAVIFGGVAWNWYFVAITGPENNITPAPMSNNFCSAPNWCLFTINCNGTSTAYSVNAMCAAATL